MVGLPMCSCQSSTGTWLVTMVDARSVPVVDDLHQVAPLLGIERRDRPIIQDQQLHPGEAFSACGHSVVAAGDAEPFQQSRHR